MKRLKQTGGSLELAMQLFRDGDKRGAGNVCRELLRRTPDDARILYLLGTIELEAGRTGPAVELLERAVVLTPTAAFLCNLGLAYAKAGALANAHKTLTHALSLDSKLTEARFNLGLVELDRGEVEEAARHLARAAADRPGSAPIMRAQARALFRLGQLSAKRGQTEDSIRCFEDASRLDPANAGAQRELALSLLRLGLLEAGLARLEKAVELEPQAEVAHSRLVFYAAFSPRYGAERILGLARHFDEQHAKSHRKPAFVHDNDRDPERRLRVGYVSPEFRDHVQRLFTVPVLREHARERVEIFCYSSSRPEDGWTSKLKGYADHWRDVADLDDASLAERIREDRIDVLVDLTMHMDGQRLKLFAAKPAPVQIAWLAYPGTTGLGGMDYRLTDPCLDPPNQPLPYSEQSLWLADTFWCYDPLSEEPAVNALPAASAGHVTFGCLNNFLKVNAGVLELWARVLAELPSSRLLLLAPSERARAFALETLESHGIERERVEFVGLQWRSDYLATYHRIDIALDCFPYNGHTTSLDAFYMGVPVVTLVGQTVVGRAGLDQAQLLGLPELAAPDPAGFVAATLELARDLPRLAALRQSLRSRLRGSPLMDAPRFTRQLEAAYREAWRRWCAS